jgi:hypothetical protein
MGAFFFNILLWVMGIVNIDDGSSVHDIKARGKCRQIVVENNTVKIQFLNSEDANLFAKDLKQIIED